MHGRGRWYQGGRQGRPPRHDPDTGYKLVAGVAAGCFAAWLLTALISAVLSVVAGVFSSPGASFLIFWAIAAALAYRYLKTRKAKGWNLRRETRRIEIDFHDEREPREYRQEHYDDGDDDRRRDDAGKERVEKAKADRLGAWEVIQGLFAGFCVVLAVNLSAAAIADASAALAAAASASWVAGGASVFALFRRFMHSREQDEVPPSREVKAQVRRIKSKCRGLSRQARRVGGVFDDLSWQAPELSEQANELYRLLLTLRKAARTRWCRAASPPRPMMRRSDARWMLRGSCRSGWCRLWLRMPGVSRFVSRRSSASRTWSTPPGSRSLSPWT